jgi:hypothetical protein
MFWNIYLAATTKSIKQIYNILFYLFLFDGLDELNNVINTMKELKDEGYKIWIFCTKYLEKTLRRELQIYSVENMFANICKRKA